MRLSDEGVLAFSAVVREGSVAGAAQSLGMSKTAINQSIKVLEDEVGCPLLQPGHHCYPTETGRRVAEYASKMASLRTDLIEEIERSAPSSEQHRRIVRIAVNNDSLATWFPSVIKTAFEELNVVFEIVPDDQEFTEERMRSGDASAIVTSSEKSVPGCDCIPLGAMDYVSVASKELHNDIFQQGVTLDTLENTVCIAYDAKDTIQDQWMRSLFGGVAKVQSHFVPSYDGYLACCLNGVGWGLVPWVSAMPNIASDRLVELSPGRPVRVPLYWQYKNHQSGDIVQSLGRIVSEEARLILAG